jgi:two-component system, sensor histidine kinase
VTAELARARDGGVLLTVRDTGTGMDADTVERLFTRFYQADNSLRRRTGGTGLGLEISRNLARMMGGDIAVSSEPGAGSTFTVTLQLPETAPPRQAATAEGETPRGQRRLQVLVAEDHPVNLKYLSILLEKMGHEAVFCENGQQALELLQRQHFDVVLLDYHMPVLDGLATTEAIRALGTPAASSKIILVTADVVNDTRKRAMEVGVDEFASKPLQAEDLQRALERCGLHDEPARSTAARDAQASSPFPLSAYEMPQRLPEAAAPVALDTEVYGEIAGMMPADAMQQMLATLFEPPEGTVHTLLRALQEGERGQIGYHAHRLKGTALLLGFLAIADTACQIERRMNAPGDHAATDLLETLQRHVAATRQALQQFDRQAQA